MKWSLEIHDSLESTQDLIKKMAAQGALEGNAVQALIQTQGRGRHGREWISGSGNLYLSFLLRPACMAFHIGQISSLTSLAVARALQSFLEEPDVLRLKWPNDLLLKGGKCAGILLESDLAANNTVEWVSVGIGINFENAPEIGVALKPHISLTSLSLDLDVLREALFSQFEECYKLWQDQGFAPLKEAWCALAHKKGETLSVKLGSDVIKGRFYDIDDRGALLLETAHGEIRTITAGDIYALGD